MREPTSPQLAELALHHGHFRATRSHADEMNKAGIELADAQLKERSRALLVSSSDAYSAAVNTWLDAHGYPLEVIPEALRPR